MAFLRNDNLVIPQGTTWAVRWPFVDENSESIDLVGWTVRSHVRRRINSPDTLHEWSTEIGNATITGDFIEFRVTPEESSNWTWVNTKAVFDVEAISPQGEVFRVTQGTITISPEVTR